MIANCPPFPCDCSDNPLNGYSSEAVDVIVPLATAFVSVPPPLGTTWCKYECMAFASDVAPPVGSGSNVPVVPQFGNSPQSCTLTCPDGLPFVFEVNAGSFSAPTQAAANALALTFACAQAQNRMICLSALSNAVFTQGVPFSASITATGNSLATGTQTNNWQLVSGSLPSGLTFNGGNLASDQVTITGTPTQGGTFTFAVACTDPLGDTQTKFYTLNCVLGFAIITNTYTSGTVNNADCSITNSTSVGFALGVPEVGYDTRYNSIQNACGFTGLCHSGTTGVNVSQFNDFDLAFTSPTLQTWSIKVVMILGGSQPSSALYSVTIGGQVQTGWTVVGNVATLITTFTTNNCAQTLVNIHGAGFAGAGQTSCVSTEVEWLTP